jgi:CubicO group peptidase (beta-lactamase class C family)/peptidoglycan/LPS O-acetylase OafA/YrhL
LPALFLLLAATLLAAAALVPELLADLRRDTLAALAYVTNWYLILSDQPYFDAVDRPSLLQHLWSLAIEEQFYLVWPLLFGLGMRVLRARATLVLTLAAAVGSALLMAALYEPGADPSRLYYGTDTRATGLLLGAALAMFWRPNRAAAPSAAGLGRLLDALGLLALLGLVALMVLLNEQHPLLYRGGLALTALVTAVAIAAAVHPAARLLPWLLELQPMRWIGLRSYSLYLWHWPIFMLSRPGVDLPAEGWVVQLGRFALTVLLAALSYSLVELPIRRGALGTLFRRATPEQPSAPAPASATTASRWRNRAAGGMLALSLLAIAGSLVAGLVVATPVNGTITAATGQPASTANASTAAVPTARQTSDAASASGVPAASTPTAASADEAQPISPSLAEQLQQILDETVADGSIPGAVLSVQLADGVAWSGASGVADRETGTPIAPDTLVRVGSLSKLFTAVVVLQLVEEGTLDLDEPVARWLPELLPDGERITVRQLLQHTSGLFDYLEDRSFVAEAYADPERLWSPDELVAYATQFPPLFEPGAEDGWDYSSTNYVILGMLVEQATGQSMASQLRERVFEPLALERTFSVPPDEPVGEQARGYSEGEDQTAVALSFGFATANIVTSVEDLARFGAALFSGELLSSSSLEQMQQFVDGKGQYDMPALGYGLGLMSNVLPVGSDAEGQARESDIGQVIGHIGGFGGFRSALWYDSEREILIALDVNQAATDPNDLAARVLDTILGHQGQ